MTEWEGHVRQWSSCRKCELAATRQRVVLARGDVPCNVLFIGEAPGQSEDALGQPFVGPAGQLLDWIVRQAVPAGTPCCFSNLVGCVPRSDDGSKAAEPPHESITACALRVTELVGLCRPRLIVRVGKLAADYLTQGYRYSVKIPGNIPMVDIVHPAAILRMPFAARGLARQRCVVVVRNAIEDLATTEADPVAIVKIHRDNKV